MKEEYQTRPIGSRFMDGEYILEVVEVRNGVCSGNKECHYFNQNCLRPEIKNITGYCTSGSRSDGKSTVFEQVAENGVLLAIEDEYELAELIRVSFFEHGHDSWVSIAKDIINKIKLQ